MIQFGAEEVVQSLSGLFGCLFREEVSGTQGSGTQGVPPNVVALPSPGEIGPPSSTYQEASGPRALHRTKRGQALRR